MLMFTLAISCLITSNLPWFMDLTFQVPVQYSSNSIRFYFHQLIEHRFCIGPAASFFLGLLGAVLHSSPVAYWTPYDLGVSCFGVISSLLSIQFIRFSQQVYWGGLSFPPPMDHVLSELSTMTHPSWVALHGMAHSLIELCKPLCYDKAVIHEGDVYTLRTAKAGLPVLLHRLYQFCNLGEFAFMCSVMSNSLLPPWTVAHLDHLSMGFFKARILELVAISFSRGSSWPKDWTCVSCIRRWILYQLHHFGSPFLGPTSA